MVVTRLIVDSLCNFRVQYNTTTRLDWEQGVYGSESDWMHDEKCNIVSDVLDEIRNAKEQEIMNKEGKDQS